MKRSRPISIANPGNGATATAVDTSLWTNGPSITIGRHTLFVYVTAQAVTINYSIRKKGGTWKVVNNAGAGDIVAAGNTGAFWFVAIGEEQKLEIVCGATAPTLFEVVYNSISDEMASVA